MIWIFPYFFESRILECFPSFSMLDYQVLQEYCVINMLINIRINILQSCVILHSQVDYDNHPLYKHGKTGRKQSPVRLFTNLSPKDIILPEDEGYRCTKKKQLVLTQKRFIFIYFQIFLNVFLRENQLKIHISIALRVKHALNHFILESNLL